MFVLGLCNDSLHQIKREMPPPTNADLQGFWEMVLLQVENVDALFADLDRLRSNDWQVSILSFLRINGLLLELDTLSNLLPLSFFLTCIY